MLILIVFFAAVVFAVPIVTSDYRRRKKKTSHPSAPPVLREADKPKPTSKTERNARLESAASLAEIDVEYLAPLLEKAEKRFNALQAGADLAAEMGSETTGAQQRELDKSRKEYYSLLKKYIKAQNIIDAFNDSRSFV